MCIFCLGFVKFCYVDMVVYFLFDLVRLILIFLYILVCLFVMFIMLNWYEINVFFVFVVDFSSFYF